jgi:hypothetical protein
MVVKTAIYHDLPGQNRPSFYATPAAWAIASFTQSLIDDEDGIVPRDTGLIVVSDECSVSTIRELSATAAQGTVSPLRFAGASPSIVAGLPALQQGIRGPTLCLTMPPDHAASAIVATIDYWLRCNGIVSVIAIAHYKQGDGRHLFKGLIATCAGDDLIRHVVQLTEPPAGDRVVTEYQCAAKR